LTLGLVWGISNYRDSLLRILDNHIAQIEIRGDFTHLNKADLQEHLSGLLGRSFLFTDLSLVKQQVNAMPWVYDSSVARHWPNGLVINVVLQTPVAYWNNDGLLNEYGEVFRPKNARIGMPLPRLWGGELAEPSLPRHMLTLYYKLQHQLGEYKLKLETLKYLPRGVWEMTLDNGIAVALGAEPLERKVARIGKAFVQALGEKSDQIVRIDARYPNGLAVRWKKADSGDAAVPGSSQPRKKT
jgi:cell division protein FtsQ